MIRPFLFLACLCALLLVASVASGFVQHDGAGEPSWVAAVPHQMVGWVTLVAVLGLHASVFLYLKLSGSRCVLIAVERELGDRIVAQTTKNRLRSLVFLYTSSVLMVLAAITGVADGMTDGNESLIHLGVSSFAMAFNLGTFVVEYASIAAQTHLEGELVPA